MSRNVYGLVVLGDGEVNRYLQSFMENVTQTVDAVFVYDDQSTDDGADLVRSFHNVVYDRRPDDVPTFMDHEGAFRQASWMAFQKFIGPHLSDWVLCIDTDEVLVAGTECRPCEIKHVLDNARAPAVLLDRPEVWNVDDDGWPWVRTDGFWGGIRCTRLFQYAYNGKINDVPMACGSEPTYVSQIRTPSPGAPLQLLHYGYAKAVDREEKHHRYTTHPAPGHNPRHIRSILRAPTLARWSGLIPPVMARGKQTVSIS